MSLFAARRTRALNHLRPAILTRRIGSESGRDKRPPSLVEHAPGWNEDLATPSEAFVKADRESTTIDEMRQKTVDYAQWQTHRDRYDPELEQTHATYTREEIGGPLGHAGLGEFEGVVGADDLGPDNVPVEPNGRIHERTTASGGGTAGQAKV